MWHTINGTGDFFCFSNLSTRLSVYISQAVVDVGLIHQQFHDVYSTQRCGQMQWRDSRSCRIDAIGRYSSIPKQERYGFDCRGGP